jgi:hypothetical protein
LNLRLHPYQQNAGNRYAKRRSRRSCPTVEGQVMCSHRVQLCVLPCAFPRRIAPYCRFTFASRSRATQLMKTSITGLGCWVGGAGRKEDSTCPSKVPVAAGSVRSAPADADLLAPLIDEVRSAVGGDLVGPVPQAQIQLHRGTGEDDLGPLDGACGVAPVPWTRWLGRGCC